MDEWGVCQRCGQRPCACATAEVARCLLDILEPTPAADYLFSTFLRRRWSASRMVLMSTPRTSPDWLRERFLRAEVT